MQKLKVGDLVQVTSGAERSQKTNRGKVIRIDAHAARVSVEGLRLIKRHIRKGAKKAHPDGGIVEEPGTIALANLAVVCPKCNKPTRVGIRETKKGEAHSRSRYCKRCEEIIDVAK